MRDTPGAIRVVERLVSLNDLPEPEIMLEVQVLEIQRTVDTIIGPNLPQSATYSFVPGATGPGIALDQISAPGLENFTINNTVSIDFKKDLAQGDLLANPRIRVKNRGQAKILIGERVPIVTSNVTGTAATVSQSVNYIDVGLKLDVEPIISMNNEVAIKLLLEVSTIVSFVSSGTGATATRIPQVGTRTAETLLSLKNGETEVLAGLIQDEDTKNFKGIAGLIDLPILNRLFTSQTKKRKKTEIVMLITPRILRNTKQPTNAESEFHFGTSNMPGKLPVTIGKTAPESLAIATAGSGGGASSALSRAAGTFSPSNESQDSPNPFARSADASPMISLQAPPRVALDKEFTVRVGLIGAQPSVTSEMELSYDTDMLQALDDEDNSGRRALKLGKDGTGKTAQIRFKVISANPGTAEIFVQNIISEDKETSESVEVTEPRAANIIIQ
jgi:general secretion pathway protein D